MPLMTIFFGDLVGGFVDSKSNPDRFNAITAEACRNLTILALAIFVAGYFQAVCWSWAGENQSLRIRQLYFKSILGQDVAWFDQTSTGELTTRLTGDLHVIQEGISGKVGQILQFMTTFVAGFVLAFTKGWELALVLSATLPILAGTAAFLSKLVMSGTGEGQDAYAQAGSVAQQTFSSFRTVVAFGGEEKEIAKYEKHLGDAEKAAIKKSWFNAGGVGMMQIIMFSVYALAFWFGAIEIKKGIYDAAKLINVFFAIVIGAFSLGQAGPYFGSVAAAQGAAHRIYNTIERKSPICGTSDEGTIPPPDHQVKGVITFENVSFAYPTRSEVTVLKDFSMVADSGKTVALVGMSGSGKSTIVKLFERFYDPTQGVVKLDGVDIKELNVKWLRQHIGIVSQEPVLFDTTIRQNLLYGLKEDASSFTPEHLDKMCEAACVTANAWGFISKLPKGLDTNVGEAGGMMSGGQKQRIAIARAIMRDPPILLLDEATSALDTTSERIVQQALDSASKNRTTIVIAHRLSTIRNASTIIVMDKGSIVEQGDHDSLVAKGGVYAELVEQQQIRGGTDSEGEKSEGFNDDDVANIIAAEQKQQDVKEGVEVVVDGHASPRSSISRTKSLTRRVMRIDDEEADKKAEEKAKKKVPYGRILKMNQPEWYLFVLGLIGSGLNGVWMPVFAIVFSEILTVFGIVDKDEMQRKANFWALIFVIIGLAACICQLLQIGCFSVAGAKLTTRLRSMTFRKLVRMDVGYFDREDNATGKITGRLAEDANLVQGLSGQNFGQILSLAVTAITGLVIAFVSSWRMTLVIIGTVPLMAAAGYFDMKALTGTGDLTKKAYLDASRVATEAIEFIRTVHTLTQEQAFFDQFRNQVQGPHKVALRGVFISSIGFAMSASVQFLTFAASFYYGSRLILWDLHDPLEVLKAMFAIVFTAMGAGQIATFAPDAAKAQLAAHSILAILDREPVIDTFSPEGTVPNAPQGLAKIKSAEFSYPTRPNVAVLRGLNIEAQPGTTVALVGASGCGKSTVMGLIERWYDVKGGHVDVDGLDVREWILKKLREEMALVGQEPMLFDVSIRENIAYGSLDGDAVLEDTLVAAAKKANIHEFILSLPDGYATNVGERGGQLSGGQKQRIAIARALIRNPKILLLDEATSALDSESEQAVQKALDEAAKGRTTIVIAHRLATVQNAQRIYLIRDGVVVEEGTHDELMRREVGYWELAVQQSLGKAAA